MIQFSKGNKCQKLHLCPSEEAVKFFLLRFYSAISPGICYKVTHLRDKDVNHVCHVDLRVPGLVEVGHCRDELVLSSQDHISYK